MTGRKMFIGDFHNGDFYMRNNYNIAGSEIYAIASSPPSQS